MARANIFRNNISKFILPQEDPIDFDALSDFQKSFYRNKLIDEYCTRMSKSDRNIVVDWGALEVLERQGFAKYLDQCEVNPRSVYSVNKLYNALGKFRPGRIPETNLDNPHVRAGIKLAYKCFARGEDDKFLQPMDLVMSTVKVLTTAMDSSCGLTAFGLKKKDAMSTALAKATAIVQRKVSPAPCIAYARTQENFKTRLVWGFPYEMTIIEGTLARPIIDHYLTIDTPMAFGKTSLSLGSKINGGANSRRFTYSVDMSSYDASISGKLIDVAFRIISTWFKSTHYINNLLHIIKSYFITTPIVMPDHNVYFGKRHGVPSGSYFTQLVDSIVNVIIAGALSSKMNLRIDKQHIQVLGDDLIFFSNTKVYLDSLASQARQLFGVEFNARKSQFVRNSEMKEIHYLGRDWQVSRPHTSFLRILARIVLPENRRKYSKERSRRLAEIKAVINSYGLVYREGLKFYGISRKVFWMNIIDVENQVFKYDFNVDKDHMSGLLRYQMREGLIDGKHHGKSIFEMMLR